MRGRNGQYFEENELEADDLRRDGENLLEHKVNYGDLGVLVVPLALRSAGQWKCFCFSFLTCQRQAANALCAFKCKSSFPFSVSA